MAFLALRKLLAKGFPFGVAPCCFLPTGNCSRRVSHSAWLHAVACPQETVGERFPVRLGSMVFLAHRKLFCVWFPVRLDSMVFHTDRKLFAYSFLFGLTPLHFISAGNYSRKVSCPTWHHSISYRQKTFCEGFPVRLDSMVLLAHRKLLAKEISRLRFAPLEMTKGRGSMVFLTYRKLFTPPLTPVNCPLAAAALFLYT